MQHKAFLSSGALLVALSVFFGCSRAEEPAVKSHLSGRIVVSQDVDSSGNYEGFEIVVASLVDGVIDTMASAVTAVDGTFSTDVKGRVEGVYPITIRRSGGVLKQGQIVVADGDSATLNITLPTGRPISLRSPENAAWMAYRNTKAAQAGALRRLAQMGSQDSEQLRASVLQAADILWKLADTYPNTLASELAKVESVVVLATWDDSLTVERLRDLPLDVRGFVDAARAGWRAQSRIRGLDSALALIDRTRERLTDPADAAAMHAERVVALMSGKRVDEARREAKGIASDAEDPDWRSWAESLLYDLDHLQPGLRAPSFSAIDRNGSPFELDALRGLVLLEFYRPGDDAYHQELPLRSQLDQIAGSDELQIVSVSLEIDPELNEAFIDTRDLPGTHLVAEGGADGELARLYNVKSTPRRFLLRDGVILSTYHGRALESVAGDIQLSLAQSGE
jgi:peroxiredoxin